MLGITNNLSSKRGCSLKCSWGIRIMASGHSLPVSILNGHSHEFYQDEWPLEEPEKHVAFSRRKRAGYNIQVWSEHSTGYTLKPVAPGYRWKPVSSAIRPMKPLPLRGMAGERESNDKPLFLIHIPSSSPSPDGRRNTTFHSQGN
jgi:hypothetical protein